MYESNFDVLLSNQRSSKLGDLGKLIHNIINLLISINILNDKFQTLIIDASTHNCLTFDKWSLTNKTSSLNFNQNQNVKIKITIRICMTRANLFCQWHSGTTFCLGNMATKVGSADFLRSIFTAYTAANIDNSIPRVSP